VSMRPHGASERQGAGASIFKTISEIFTVKETKKGINVCNTEGSEVYLPPMMADAALKILEGGSKQRT
jgi:hypothetical protein